MIRVIKSELRKSRRPAVLVSALVLAAITILFYSANWYVALHPGNGPREAVSLLTLYPDQFVNNIMGAAFPIGAAVCTLLLAVRFINVITNGQYKWITDNFVNQNANALTQTFTSPAFGPRLPSVVSAEHAVAVLFAYGVGLLIISAGLLRLRDVT